jgi:hypothetical protein
VYVVPERPLLIAELLAELFALRDLSHDATFVQQDERLPRELDFFIEDAQRRLMRALRPLRDTATMSASWWWHDGTAWREERVRTEADMSRLLSRLCNRWFDATPVLNNEVLNQHEPSKQQVRAAERVIDALLGPQDDVLPPNLGLTGYGPDYLIFRTVLVRSGLLRPAKEEQDPDDTLWQLEYPLNNPPLAQVWDKVQEFLDTTLEDEQEAAHLVDMLQSPPYGLRRGVLPVLLAAMLRPRLHVLTLRRNRKVVSPLTGQVLTELCRKPERFTIEMGPWDARRAALWQVLQEKFHSFVSVQEQGQQPLSYLSLALVRWLQTQPRFCRDTDQLSPDAQRLRNLIRQGQRDPARVLLYDLLDLLDNGSQSPTDEAAYREGLADRLNELTGEIITAYPSLLYHLDSFAESHFAPDALIRQRDGYAALNYWLKQLEQEANQSLDTFRFGDTLVQRFVQAIRQDQEDRRFWDRLSYAVMGLYPHDWNDRSVGTFKSNLLDAKDRLEREIFELSEDEAAVELRMALPGEEEHTYRFRPSDLSPHGQRILQNFISTLEIAGRPLSPDERRQVVMALLHHVMEGPKSDDKRGTRKRRRR